GCAQLLHVRVRHAAQCVALPGCRGTRARGAGSRHAALQQRRPPRGGRGARRRHRLRAGFHCRARCAGRAPGSPVAGIHAAAGADLRRLSKPQAPLRQGAALRRVPDRALRRGTGLERAVRWIVFALALQAQAVLAQDWMIVSKTGRAEAGKPFELTVIAPAGQNLPQELEARMKVDVAEITLTLKETAPALNGQRTYAAPMPISASGPVSLQLGDHPSNVLVLMVVRPAGDAVQTLTGLGPGGREPPLSENDPMYFVVGTRGGTSARFQLSFKYRLFDFDAGIGQERPWLSG